MSDEKLTDEELAGLACVAMGTLPGESAEQFASVIDELLTMRRHMARHFPGRGCDIGDLTVEEEYMLDVCEEAIAWRAHQFEQAPLINAIDDLIAFRAKGKPQPLRAHRQAALSEEDVEALRWAKRVMAGTLPQHLIPPGQRNRALSVLTRLVEQKP